MKVRHADAGICNADFFQALPGASSGAVHGGLSHRGTGPTQRWRSSTLVQELGVVDASEDGLYETMDWPLEHQSTIQRKPAERHLSNGLRCRTICL